MPPNSNQSPGRRLRNSESLAQTWVAVLPRPMLSRWRNNFWCTLEVSILSVRSWFTLPGIVGLVCVFFASLVTGCTSTNVSSHLPDGADAYEVVGAASENTPPAAYRIRPFDVLKITTYTDPGLSFDEVPVDAGGQFSFPFIGLVTADGLTARELELEIKQKLDDRYTRDAQVTVFITTAASQIFTVEGDVKSPGAFDYRGKTTLLQGIARAGSPTETAKLNEVVVFRIVNDERYGAVFDLNDIREGKASDPELLPGDTVFVGYSAIKSGWQQFLSLGPIFNAFTRF